jgi:hypothetical protein
MVYIYDDLRGKSNNCLILYITTLPLSGPVGFNLSITSVHFYYNDNKVIIKQNGTRHINFLKMLDELKPSRNLIIDLFTMTISKQK